MDMKDLKPAGSLATRYGVKSVVFGPPGSGKTPLLNTAPRPVLCAVEPGLLSMRGSNLPTYEAFTRQKIDDFFKWLTNSKEALQFDTVGIDSISQVAEIILLDELKKNKDGRAAYGKMSIAVMEICTALFYMQQKHVYLIAKQGIDEFKMKKPYFPGQDLNVKIPHFFDEVICLDNHSMVGQPAPIKAFRCIGDYNTFARDRSGNLAEFEPPNLEALFKKAMQ